MRKYLWKVIGGSDVILEVVDSRIPNICRNRKLEKKIEKMGKDIIIVLNKSDLVPENFIQKVKEIFDQEYPTVYVSTKTRRGSRALRRVIKLYSPEKDKVVIGVVGYPNTGKSSVINMLRGRKVSFTGSMPGITKGIQLVRLSKKFYLIDTPGIIPKKRDLFENILIGAVDPSNVEYPEKYAYQLLKIIREKCPDVKIYGKIVEDPEKFLLDLSKKMKKDLKTVSRILLKDWIKGKIKAYWL